MAVLNGKILGPPADSVRPENHTRPNTGIEPYSRIRVTLQDVSLMDAPSVQIACQEVMTGANGLLFPIDFHLSYDPAKVKDRHTYSVSARVTACSGAIGGCREGLDSDDEPLTWITMTRHTVELTPVAQHEIEVDVERV